MSIPLPQTPGAGGAEDGEGKSTFRASAPDARGLQIGSLTFDEISKANRVRSSPPPLSPLPRNPMGSELSAKNETSRLRLMVLWVRNFGISIR